MSERLIFYFTRIAFEPSMVAQNLMSSASLVIISYAFKKNLKNVFFAFIHLAALFASFTVISGLIMTAMNHPGAGRYISYLLIAAMYAVFFCKADYKSRIVMFVALFALESCLTEFSSYVPRLLEGAANASVWDTIIRNFIVALLPVISLYFRKFSMGKLSDIPKMSVMFVSAYGTMSVILSLISNINKRATNINGVYIASTVFMGLIVINLLMYYMVYKITADHSRKIDYIAERSKLESDRQMLRLAKKNYEDIREIRHEIKNQYSYIELLLGAGKYEEAQTFFDDAAKKAATALSYVYCKNETVNDVLNLEIAKAQMHGISIDTNIIIPEQLPLNDNDICSLVTNLVDNAIEGAAKAEMVNKVVSVSTQMLDGKFFFKVVNPMPAQVSDSDALALRTTKPDRQRHGYGSKIVAKIVKKYNGTIKYSIENGKFTAEVLMFIKPQEECA